MSDQLRLFAPLDSVAVSLGADDVVDALFVAADNAGISLEIIRTGSRGMHWLEPLVEIEIDGVRHGFGPVDAKDAGAVLASAAKGVCDGTRAIGPVEDIPFFAEQTRLIFSRCGVTDPLNLNEYMRLGGYAGLDIALGKKRSEVCELILQSGLRGRGGAGFLAGIKWKTVEGASADQKYIVVNADEGDSGTFADRMIMEGDPYLLLEGMTIAGVATGATKGFIYLRSEYPIAAKILTDVIQTAYREGLLGSDIKGSGVAFDIELFIGAGSYVCGEETSLLNSLEGKRGEVRAKPPIPALEGLFGKPTLVHNVISICSVPQILTGGADAYAEIGVGRSTGTMPFQLAGNIKHGGLFEVGFGVTLDKLVNELGGGARSGGAVRAVQIGGPLGAYLPPAMFHLQMDYETMTEHGAGVGHGGVVVFDETVDFMEQARYAFEFCAEESCGKCTPCRIGAVRGVEVMDRLRDGDSPEQQLELIHDLCELMVDGSMCAMGGMTPIPVQSAMEHFPEDFRPQQRP